MNEDCCSSFASSYDNSLENIGAHDSFVAYGQGWAEAGMSPFRGIKSAMAEGGVRVAAFANHSSLHNPGRVSQTYLTMQDVMPTLLCQAIALGAAATGLGLNRFTWTQDDNKPLPEHIEFHRLVVANRILANESVVDAFGHVSVRHPDNPDRYVMSHAVSPALVEYADLMEFE